MDRNSGKYTLTATIIITMMFVSLFQVSSVSSEPITTTCDRRLFRTDVPHTVIQEETTKIPAGTAYDSQLENKIIQAYIMAYSLEERVWDQTEAFETKEAVFHFMQQGFSDDFAWDLADYYWTDPEGLLGAGSFLTVPEVTIYVLEVDMENNEASVWHKTDEWDREHWSMDEYKIVTLLLKDGFWKVTDERSVDTPPA